MTQEFYVLHTPVDTQLYAGGQWINDTRERCPISNNFTEASEPSTIEIALNHVGQRGFTEHLWNSHSLPIFRQDLVNVWQKTGLSGLTIKPVIIVGWYRKPGKSAPKGMPSYYRLVTANKVNLRTPTALGDPCPLCGFVSYSFPKVGTHLPSGLKINMESWNGSDFFGLANYTFIFCTRHAAEVTLRAGYNTHIAFVRTENWQRWEEFDIRKWTPRAYHEYLESFFVRRIEDL